MNTCKFERILYLQAHRQTFNFFQGLIPAHYDDLGFVYICYTWNLHCAAVEFDLFSFRDMDMDAIGLAEDSYIIACNS